MFMLLKDNFVISSFVTILVDGVKCVIFVN
jgi:hypothetical protein